MIENLLMYTCAKHCHKRWSSDKAIAKIKRCSFFCLTVYIVRHYNWSHLKCTGLYALRCKRVWWIPGIAKASSSRSSTTWLTRSLLLDREYCDYFKHNLWRNFFFCNHTAPDVFHISFDYFLLLPCALSKYKWRINLEVKTVQELFKFAKLC